MTRLNQGHSDKSVEKKLKNSRRGSLSPDNVKFGHFTLLFSLRKQPSFFAPGPSGVSRAAFREEGRLFSQASCCFAEDGKVMYVIYLRFITHVHSSYFAH